MSRELLLVRHAKSSWSEEDLDDFDRPLKARGKREAKRLGAYLRKTQHQPDWVLCSTAKRARQTLKAMRQELTLDNEIVTCKDRIYMAPLAALLRELANIPREKLCVMIVGHNPGLEDLLCYLSSTDPPENAEGKILTTSALARLQLPNDWSQLASGCGKLLGLQLARLLTKN